jgi:hypothetical protein
MNSYLSCDDTDYVRFDAVIRRGCLGQRDALG